MQSIDRTFFEVLGPAADWFIQFHEIGMCQFRMARKFNLYNREDGAPYQWLFDFKRDGSNGEPRKNFLFQKHNQRWLLFQEKSKNEETPGKSIFAAWVYEIERFESGQAFVPCTMHPIVICESNKTDGWQKLGRLEKKLILYHDIFRGGLMDKDGQPINKAPDGLERFSNLENDDLGNRFRVSGCSLDFLFDYTGLAPEDLQPFLGRHEIAKIDLDRPDNEVTDQEERKLLKNILEINRRMLDAALSQFSPELLSFDDEANEVVQFHWNAPEKPRTVIGD